MHLPEVNQTSTPMRAALGVGVLEVVLNAETERVVSQFVMINTIFDKFRNVSATISSFAKLFVGFFSIQIWDKNLRSHVISCQSPRLSNLITPKVERTSPNKGKEPVCYNEVLGDHEYVLALQN